MAVFFLPIAGCPCMLGFSRLKDGAPIETMPRVQSKKYQYSANRLELVLPKLHLSDVGIFTCILENRYGRVVHNITLRPQG